MPVSNTKRGSTVDEAEVAQFARLAAEWWDPNGSMAALHKFNPVRLGYIRNQACARFGRDPKRLDSLAGLRRRPDGDLEPRLASSRRRRGCVAPADGAVAPAE